MRGYVAKAGFESGLINFLENLTSSLEKIIIIVNPHTHLAPASIEWAEF